MRVLIGCLAVGFGGFLGALCRWGVATLSTRVFGTGFPTGTLLINLSGSFALGWFMARIARGAAAAEPTQLAVTVGFLGAYTTFSTFMYESDVLLRNGAAGRAVLNLVGSVALGLLAVRLGVALGQRV
jgi:CrcB protein